MTRNQQLLSYGVVFAVMLSLAAGWSVNWALEQKQKARIAAKDVARCEQLVQSIMRLRGKPTVAMTEAMEVQELGQRIESASSKAQLPNAALEGVFPQPPGRVEGSPYLQKPTSLVMRGVSLPQLTTFLHDLTNDTGMNVRDLRLRTPHGQVDDHIWDAEATLTYLIYSPASKD